MKPKPKHLGRNHAETFKDESVVDVYHHRPPHHPSLFRFLAHLIPDGNSLAIHKRN